MVFRRFVLANIALTACLMAPVCAQEEAAEKKCAMPCRESDSEATTKVVTSRVLEKNADAVVVEVTLESRADQGVPYLSSIPYINRKFKNVGIGRATYVCRIPLQPGASQTTKGSKAGKGWTQNKKQGSVAATPAKAFFLDDDVHYHAPGNEFAVIQATKAPATKLATECRTATSEAQCAVRFNTAAVAKSCACKSDCKAGNATQAQMHETLVRATAENVKLKAELQMQRELNRLREEFVEQLVEARVEVARLEAQLDFAKHRESLARAHQVPMVSGHETTQLRAQNTALKAQLMEFARQRAATNATTGSVSNAYSTKDVQKK